MQSIQMQLTGEPLQKASRLFNHHSVESQFEQFVDRKLAAPVFESDNDPVDPCLWPGKSLQGGIERLFALVLIGQYAIPADNMHACILTCPEQIDNRPGSFSSAENIHSLPEDLPSDDPFVGAPPDH